MKAHKNVHFYQVALIETLSAISIHAIEIKKTTTLQLKDN